MVFYPQLLAEVPEYIVIELPSIIRDKDSKDAEAASDAFLDEASDILLNDNGKRFCLDPFSKIGDPYNKELELPHCHRERSYYVERMAKERSLG